ncbi:MAG: cell division protein FtsZ [Alphaproteobacteria bacterium]
MSLNLNIEQIQPELRPHILVIGVGGAGCNAVNNMIRAKLEGVEFLVANTDSQSLAASLCERRIQIGANLTQGLGAGARPEVGRAAAEEDLEELLSHLNGVHMVFITAGMGGGTGTGAAPVIARAIREQGILTVGVVTKPFHFEGQQRMRIADQGIQELQQYVDTLIVIPNQNLFRIASEKTTFADAFNMADEVLNCGVRGVTDLMVMPGLINLDFADIRTVMGEMGKAMMGTGEADGDRRAVDAAEAAISNPLLDDVSMKGARGVLINISGGGDMTLYEVDEACNRIREEVDPDANIIFGATFDDGLDGRMRVSVVATGIEASEENAPRTTVLSLAADGGRPVPAPRLAPRAADVPVKGQENLAAAAESAIKERAPEPVEPVETSRPAAPAPQVSAPAQPQIRTYGQPSTPHGAPEQPQRQPLRAGPRASAAPAMQGGSSVATGRVSTPPTYGAHSGYPGPSMTATARAMPEPEVAERPFLPPEAIEPERRRQPLDAPVETDDHGKGKLRFRGKSGPSLFERMTGTGRARREDEAEHDEAGYGAYAEPSRQAPAPRQEPQAQLSGLDPIDQPEPRRQSEDDMLDIPAFLRRQAN